MKRLIPYFFRRRRAEFNIKKGKHYSKPRFLTLFRENYLIMNVKFNRSMLYRANKMDHINKLFGFSAGFCNPTKDSRRFGWRPTRDNKIEVWAYHKVKGLKEMRKIITVGPSDSLTMYLHERNGFTVYSVMQFNHNGTKHLGNGIVELDNGEKKVGKRFRWMLYPYFGGVPKAVRNIKIKMIRYI